MWDEISRHDVYWWTKTFLEQLHRNARDRRDREASLQDLERALSS
jgi:trehalose-6-phosphate synthase